MPVLHRTSGTHEMAHLRESMMQQAQTHWRSRVRAAIHIPHGTRTMPPIKCP